MIVVYLQCESSVSDRDGPKYIWVKITKIYMIGCA